MNLLITRKTYYAMGLAAAACTMAAAFLGLAGEGAALLEDLAFVFTCLMLLFLSAVKGSPAEEKRRYFLGFLLALAANMQLSRSLLPNYILLALPWPVLGWAEVRRGNPVDRNLRFLALAEALAATARVALTVGVWGIAQNPWLCYGLEILAAAARGWLAMTLYRLEITHHKGDK